MLNYSTVQLITLMEANEPTTVDTREFLSPVVEACEIIILMSMWNNKMNCVS